MRMRCATTAFMQIPQAYHNNANATLTTQIIEYGSTIKLQYGARTMPVWYACTPVQGLAPTAGVSDGRAAKRSDGASGSANLGRPCRVVGRSYGRKHLKAQHRRPTPQPQIDDRRSERVGAHLDTRRRGAETPRPRPRSSPNPGPASASGLMAAPRTAQLRDSNPSICGKSHGKLFCPGFRVATALPRCTPNSNDAKPARKQSNLA